MLKQTLCTSVALFLFLGIVQADEFAATLIKVADGNVTFSRGIGKKKKELTLPAAQNCKVSVAKYDKKAKIIEAGDEVAGGLANPIFSQLDKESIEAWVRTNKENDKILELRIYKSTKKKK
jgi:hypothetical protein